MNTDIHRLEPAFDFSGDGSSVLLYQGQAEMCIEGNRYTGDGEVCLDLLPRANIHLYGYFSGDSVKDAMETRIGQKEISSFAINGHQIEGFMISSMISSGGNTRDQQYNIKWCPKSEPINGVGDELTKMTRVVFHIFNFLDLFGTRVYGTKRNSDTRN